MADLSYTISGLASGSGGSQSQAALDRQNLFGFDFYYDVREGNDADLHVTPASDYLMVDGHEALRQSLIRRMITNPGEYANRPTYGAGLRAYVKERRTPDRIAEAQEKVRAQALRDPRVEVVDEVVIETFEGGLKLLLAVTPKGGPARNRPIGISLEIRT